MFLMLKQREIDLEVKNLEEEIEIATKNVSYGITWHLAVERFHEDSDYEEEIGIHLKPDYDNKSKYAFLNLDFHIFTYYISDTI